MRGFHGRRNGDRDFMNNERGGHHSRHGAFHMMRAMMAGGFGGARFGGGMGGFGPDGEGFGGPFGEAPSAVVVAAPAVGGASASMASNCACWCWACWPRRPSTATN
jgi:hypothetical protein